MPAGYLVFTSKKTPVGLGGRLLPRTSSVPLVQANVPGTVAVSPFGPNIRTILVNVDPQKLQKLQPVDRRTWSIRSMAGNVGRARGQPVHQGLRCRWCRTTPWSEDIQEIGENPACGSAGTYTSATSPTLKTRTDVNYGYAWSTEQGGLLADHQEGHRLDADRGGRHSRVDADFQRRRPRRRERAASVRRIADSAWQAIRSVASEGLIGATLTGLMILLFLRDLRSVSWSCSIFRWRCIGLALRPVATGNTINIMSLGGMALAIGMLVDEATVSIENIHVQMTKTKRLPGRRARQHADGRAATAGDAVHIVGLHPRIHHEDPMRSLFMPLAARGRLRHDLVLLAIEHLGADYLRMAS